MGKGDTEVRMMLADIFHMPSGVGKCLHPPSRLNDTTIDGFFFGRKRGHVYIDAWRGPWIPFPIASRPCCA
jgi:hypothetical protein